MANPNIIISGRVDIPNLFFKPNGESYIGEYTVQTSPNFTIFALVPDEIPFEVFFRNTLLLNKEVMIDYFGDQYNFTDIPLLENEVLSKNFENTKYKIEKIIKFTNSK